MLAYSKEDFLGFISYDPLTGIFTRLSDCSRACRSDKTKGYLRVFLFGRYFKAHRLAWFLFYGSWPTLQIDHIDGNKENNSINNLRDVSQTINMYNKTKAHSHNCTGVLGVGRVGKKFSAKLKVKEKLIHLGVFNTVEEAGEHYKEFKELYLDLSS